MYGQTNCWIHPDMKYIAYTLPNGDIYISTERAARNMSYQDFFAKEGQISVVLKLSGKVLSYIKKNVTYIYNIILNLMNFKGYIRIISGNASYK